MNDGKACLRHKLQVSTIGWGKKRGKGAKEEALMVVGGDDGVLSLWGEEQGDKGDVKGMMEE